MKIDAVNVRINKRPEGPHEVFVSKDDPNINFAIYLPADVLGDLESGQYSLELKPMPQAAKSATK